MGITPNVGKDYETKLEETLKADIAADKLVVPKSLKLWVNKERTSIDDALYKKIQQRQSFVLDKRIPQHG
ncbi:MAG: hypothetical protein L6V93_15440 [Clostridiales bacterium]|nr:MAG: hypothetical protein L6V93_15440 [Clostridiales bacterium]